MTVQMHTVEFQVPGAVNGTTPAPALSFDPESPDYKEADADGIVRFTPEDMIEITGGDLGLFDPDFGVGGTFADRFLQLLEVISAGGAGAVSISIVDAEDLVQQEEIYAGPETAFYDRDTILVPQGSELSFSGFTATPGQPVVIRINVVTWDSPAEYAHLREVACCTGGAGPVPPPGNLGPTFVYQPGGVQGGIIYADFADLVAALQSQPGPKWVEVDDSFVAIPLVPAGTFDVNGAVFQGRYGSQQTTLRGSVGSRLENLFEIRQNLQLQNADPALALVELNALEFFDVRDGASLASIVDYPVVEFSGPGVAVLRLEEATIQNLALGDTVVAVKGGVGTSFVLESYDGSVVDADTLEIAAGSFITVRMRDLGSNFSRVHSAVAGTLAVGNIIQSSTVQPKTDGDLDIGVSTNRVRAIHNRLDLRVGTTQPPSPYFQPPTLFTYNPDAVGVNSVFVTGYGTGYCEVINNPGGNQHNILGRCTNWDVQSSVSRLENFTGSGFLLGSTYQLGGGVGDITEVAIQAGNGSFLGGYVVSYGDSAQIIHGPSSSASFTWSSALSRSPYGDAFIYVTGPVNTTFVSAVRHAKVYNRHGYSFMQGVVYANLPEYAVMEQLDGALAAFIQGRCQASVGYNGYMRVEDDAGWATGRTSGGRIETRAGQAAWARGWARDGATIYAAGHGSTAWGHAPAGTTIGAAAINADQWGVGINDLADSSRFGVGWRFKKTVGAPGAPANGDAWVANGSMYVHTNGVTKNLDAI